MKIYLANLVSSLFGLGRLPVAPASLTCLILMPFIILLCFFVEQKYLIGTSILVFLVGLISVGVVVKRKYNKEVSEIVIDDAFGLLTSFVAFSGQLYHNLSLSAVITYVAIFILYIMISNLFKHIGHTERYSKLFNNAFGIFFDDILISLCTIAVFFYLQGVFMGDIPVFFVRLWHKQRFYQL